MAWNVVPVQAKPLVLLTATLRWPVAARLAMAFAELGWRVEVAGPAGQPAGRTAAVQRMHSYGGLWPLAALRKAIECSAPVLVLPCDDRAVLHLVQLHRFCLRSGRGLDALRLLLERSLGRPSACACALARGQLAAIAREEGIRIPASSVIESRAQLLGWMEQHGLPAFMKLDGTWGGEGVVHVHSAAEALGALAAARTRPPLLQALAHSLLQRDLSRLTSALGGTLRSGRPVVTIQAQVVGRPANRAVACAEGAILAGISVEALMTRTATGPATVVKVVDHPEMTAAAARLVRRLGVSGLWGFDFILENGSGFAYLLEANPRATQICHLRGADDRSLVAALSIRWAGLPRSPSRKVAASRRPIVMFPAEWLRNPASPWLHGNHQDIPWQEPALVRDGIDLPWADRGWIARAWKWLRPILARLRIRAQSGPAGSPAGADGARTALFRRAAAAVCASEPTRLRHKR